MRIRVFAIIISLLYAFTAAGNALPACNPENFASFQILPDTLPTGDTIKAASDTTLQKKKVKKSEIEAPVVYSAEDSFIISISSKEIQLYKDAKVNYQNINLQANYVQFDMSTESVLAHGMPDSTGKLTGLPHFKQGSEDFDAHTLTYNFKSKKGYIEDVKSKQDGGFLHATETKREANGNINLKNGKYTTCDADHPHYYLALTKGISIPGKKIISGPAYLVLEDVPLPIGIPFGFFPSTRKSTSGILIPSYGEEQVRGFYLRDGGYYLVLSDHWDFRATADIFSKGTWGVGANTNYRKIYKFSGSFAGKFYTNISGEKGLSNYRVSRDYSITWSHIQDPKANPTRTFSANVNFSTTTYDRNHSYDINNYLNNRKSSSISYSKLWKYAPFNFAASFNHSQNSLDRTVDLSLPRMSFNMGTIYPMRWANKSGKQKWSDNIQMSYTSSMENDIHTVDTLLFKPGVFKNAKNGFQHSIPISWSYRPFNGFSISPSLNYRGVLYTSHVEKHWDPNYTYVNPYNKADTIHGGIVTDTLQGLTYAHSLYPSLSMTLNPKIYGMYQFRGERLKFIRHVMSPTIGLSYVPDMKKFMPNYYRSVVDSNTHKTTTYSIYDNGMYGTPSVNGQSANLNFALRNTLEMKVHSPRDTSDELKKVSLLENFDFQTSYNIITNSWSNINFNTGTRLMNNKIDVRLSALMDPYALDSLGVRSTILELRKNHRLARFTSAQLNLTMNLASRQGKGSKQSSTGNQNTGEMQDASNPNAPLDAVNTNSGMVDFSIPWSLNINYSLGYSKPGNTSQLIQSVRLSGDLSLTPKWKLGFNSGYDFVSHKVTTTDISVYRDLHCWEMRISCVPFGAFQSYNFYINVKSSILKDLKYTKRKSWYDNF